MCVCVAYFVNILVCAVCLFVVDAFLLPLLLLLLHRVHGK